MPLFSIGTTPLQRDYLQVSFPYSAVPYRYCPPRRGYRRYHSPAALLSTGAVPPQRHSREAPFPHGTAAYRYWSPMVPCPPGAMFYAAAPSRYCLPPAPRCLPSRHCCSNGAISSRYHVLQRCSLQIPLPCGAASSRHRCFMVCSLFTTP